MLYGEQMQFMSVAMIWSFNLNQIANVSAYPLCVVSSRLG